MRLTFCGHVGYFIETRGGSVLCDPWFNPAYFGSWFPYPRNDQLDTSAFATADYLYVSHLHRDHFDPEWIAAHVSPATRILLPDYPVPFLERELRSLGFEHFVVPPAGETIDLDGLRVTIVPFTAPADGPLGDSLIVLDDGTASVLNQNDARPGDLDRLRALGPFDAQIVQFSGAIWYPVAYDFAAGAETQARDREASQPDGAGPAVHRMDRRRARVSLRRAAGVSRRRPIRAERLRQRRGEHLSRPERCSSRPCMRPVSTPGRCSFPARSSSSRTASARSRTRCPSRN